MIQLDFVIPRKLLSLSFGRHNPCGSIQHDLALLVETDRFEFNPVFLRNKFHNLHSRGNNISNPDRGKKFDFLGKVDGPMAWQNVSEDR